MTGVHRSLCDENSFSILCILYIYMLWWFIIRSQVLEWFYLINNLYFSFRSTLQVTNKFFTELKLMLIYWVIYSWKGWAYNWLFSYLKFCFMYMLEAIIPTIQITIIADYWVHFLSDEAWFLCSALRINNLSCTYCAQRSLHLWKKWIPKHLKMLLPNKLWEHFPL